LPPNGKTQSACRNGSTSPHPATTPTAMPYPRCESPTLSSASAPRERRRRLPERPLPSRGDRRHAWHCFGRQGWRVGDGRHVWVLEIGFYSRCVFALIRVVGDGWDVWVVYRLLHGGFWSSPEDTGGVASLPLSAFLPVSEPLGEREQ
jgi:hypothetical protein